LSAYPVPPDCLVAAGVADRLAYGLADTGSHALVASTVEMPAGQTQFPRFREGKLLTNRSCNVPNARSTRPLLSHGQALGPRAVGAKNVDVPFAQCTTELCCAIAARGVLGIHPKNAELVAIERDRLARRPVSLKFSAMSCDGRLAHARGALTDVKFYRP